jgi:hypothetical protein
MRSCSSLQFDWLERACDMAGQRQRDFGNHGACGFAGGGFAARAPLAHGTIRCPTEPSSRFTPLRQDWSWPFVRWGTPLITTLPSVARAVCPAVAVAQLSRNLKARAASAPAHRPTSKSCRNSSELARPISGRRAHSPRSAGYDGQPLRKPHAGCGSRTRTACVGRRQCLRALPRHCAVAVGLAGRTCDDQISVAELRAVQRENVLDDKRAGIANSFVQSAHPWPNFGCQDFAL